MDGGAACEMDGLFVPWAACLGMLWASLFIAVLGRLCCGVEE
jgi:hypothetical protein